MELNMVIDINMLLDRDDIKEKIVESLVNTKKIGKEQGFNVYKDKDIVIGEIIEGEKLSLGNKERSNRKMVGALHTHTILTSTNDILPSQADIAKALKDKLNFFCVGGIKENIGMIRCFNTNNIERELDNIEINISKGDKERSVRMMIRRMLIDEDYVDKNSISKQYKIP